MAKLICTEGPSSGNSFELAGEAILGRSFDANVRLDDLSVSRRHVRLFQLDGRWLVEDLGSGNGTFVNEEMITAPVPLAEGDRIRISEHVFRYAEPASKLTGGVSLVGPATSAEKPSAMQTLDIKATMTGVLASQLAAPEMLKKANERFRMVLEISNAVQTQLDMDALLTKIMDRLFDVFPQADRGFILLKGAEENAELEPAVARERGQAEAREITVSRSVINQAITDRVAILSADAMRDNRFSAAVSVVNFQIRSMMCAPIIAGQDALGVINLDTMRQDRRFTMDDLDLLTGVANQAAFAIANARMHQQLLVRQRIERDLQLARQVQESFLPKKLPEAQGLEFCASYRAASEVGGDFYDVIPLSSGKIGILLGDVAGKGIPAALLMARLSSDVRFFALNETEPAAVVKRVNDRLCAANPEGAFVTLIYGVLDPETRELRLVNAAHPPPMLRHKSGKVDAFGSVTNFPIGAVEGNDFESETISLAPGDALCLYSDGITEALNVEKELYGLERLQESAARLASSAQQYMENILSDVQIWVGNAYQSDDLTILCLRAQ